MTTIKNDEQLLAEVNALDEAYALADLSDLRKENAHLKCVLAELVVQINEDVPVESWSSHLSEAVGDAEEALVGWCDF